MQSDISAKAARAKPLEWLPLSDGRYADGKRPGCWYEGGLVGYKIRQTHNGNFVIDDGRCAFMNELFATVDDAKATAEADWQRRYADAAAQPAPRDYTNPDDYELWKSEQAAAQPAPTLPEPVAWTTQSRMAHDIARLQERIAELEILLSAKLSREDPSREDDDDRFAKDDGGRFDA